MEYSEFKDEQTEIAGRIRELERQHHQQAMNVAEREARHKALNTMKEAANPPQFGPVIDDRQRSRANEAANAYAEMAELECAIEALKAMRDGPAATKKKS